MNNNTKVNVPQRHPEICFCLFTGAVLCSGFPPLTLSLSLCKHLYATGPTKGPRSAEGKLSILTVRANGQQGSYREETRFSHYRKVIGISALLTIQSQTRRSCLRFPFSPARELVGPRRRQVFSLPAKAGQTRRGRFPLRPLKQWRTGWALHLAALLNELS